MRRLLMIATVMLLSGCGLVKRAAISSIVAVQSNAVLTQSTFKDVQPPLHKPCAEVKAARLQVMDAYRNAPRVHMVIVVNASISRPLRKIDGRRA